MTDPYTRALKLLDSIEDIDSISIIQAHQRTDRVITAGQQLADLLAKIAGTDRQVQTALRNWHTARNT